MKLIKKVNVIRLKSQRSLYVLYLCVYVCTIMYNMCRSDECCGKEGEKQQQL